MEVLAIHFCLAPPILVVLLLITFIWPKSTLATWRFFFFSLLMGFLLTYAICLLEVFINPYGFTDVGASSPDILTYPYHYGAALFNSLFVQLVIVPATLAFLYLIRNVSRRKKEGKSKPPASKTGKPKPDPI